MYFLLSRIISNILRYNKVKRCVDHIWLMAIDPSPKSTLTQLKYFFRNLTQCFYFKAKICHLLIWCAAKDKRINLLICSMRQVYMLVRGGKGVLNLIIRLDFSFLQRKSKQYFSVTMFFKRQTLNYYRICNLIYFFQNIRC